MSVLDWIRTQDHSITKSIASFNFDGVIWKCSANLRQLLIAYIDQEKFKYLMFLIPIYWDMLGLHTKPTKIVKFAT